MDSLSFPSLSISLLAFAVGALLSWRREAARTNRTASIAAACVAMVCLGTAAFEVHAAAHVSLRDPWLPWFEANSLVAAPMVLFTGLTLMCLVLAPRRDSDGRAQAGLLILAAASIMAYSASNLLALLLGWWFTCLPFVFGLFGKSRARPVTSGFLVASCVALTAAVSVLHATEIQDLSHTSMMAFGLLVLAVVLRKGVFPAHSWVVTSFEHGPLLPTVLLFNGHLGAILIARSEMTALPQTALHVLDILSVAAMLTALFAGLRGFAEKKPRRLLAFVCVSQASFILAGIATANTAGITGALIHWLVVTTASVGLAAILRILEVRVLDVTDPEGNLGLAVKSPRLATFFLICSLALIGLPGTLGYCAEDLLFHGAMESHPLLGIALPVATAFNAINLLRLFSLLFLGVLPKHVIDIPDALPRERWPLALCVVFLIFGGLLPGVVISWRSPAAKAIAEAVGTSAGH